MCIFLLVLSPWHPKFFLEISLVLMLVHQTHILSKANLRGHLLIHIRDNREIKLTIARQQLYHTEWIVHKIPQTRSDGWGRSGRGKMLDWKTQGLEFNPQNSHEKSDCGMCPCNPSIRELKGGVGQGRAGSPWDSLESQPTLLGQFLATE